MDKEKYLNDISEIRNIMDRTSQFISLSGLSGISTGIIALAGLLTAYLLIFKDQQLLVYNAVELSSSTLISVLLVSLATLALSIGAAIFFTRRKTKKHMETVWNRQTKDLLVHLLIPLLTGGILCLMLLSKGFVGILPPLTLIFYGLALVSAGKYTLSEIKSLGIIEIFLGLTAFQFIDYGLLFWAGGFGLLQIIYGIIVQRKYKS